MMSPLQFILAFVVWLAFGLAPILLFLWIVYYLLTLPLRRNERARLFLDLLEMGLKQGHSPEKAICDAAASHDRELGVRFHLLASHLGGGERLVQSIKRVPRLIPAQLVAMLAAGERMGNVSKVLPACRQLLRDGVSQVRGALNYLLILAFVVTPFTITIPTVLTIVILPKLKEVFAGMTEGGVMPPFAGFIFDHTRAIVRYEALLLALIWILFVAYVGGPRLRGWIGRLLPETIDWIRYRLPWRRKRFQRDFSAMLSVLLDAGVPEIEAVRLAADATDNQVIRRRAERAREQLESGMKLPEAIRSIDDTGELHWRISNALQHGTGFLRALAGWHEALDAKAFQLEQAAAQITTSTLVLINGAVVAAIVIAVFSLLIHLINEAVLW